MCGRDSQTLEIAAIRRKSSWPRSGRTFGGYGPWRIRTFDLGIKSSSGASRLVSAALETLLAVPWSGATGAPWRRLVSADCVAPSLPPIRPLRVLVRPPCSGDDGRRLTRGSGDDPHLDGAPCSFTSREPSARWRSPGSGPNISSINQAKSAPRRSQAPAKTTKRTFSVRLGCQGRSRRDTPESTDPYHRAHE
jgi:hypothetical protein